MALNLPLERVIAGQPALWKRIAAFLADLFIVDSVAGFHFQSVLPRIAGGFSDTAKLLQARPDIALSVSLVLMAYGFLLVLYFSILEYRLGATLGKMLFGIHVQAEKPGYASFLIRNLPLLLVFPFILVLILDPIYILMRKDSRALSEVLSHTAAVQYYAF
ncbi:RDD family protein [Candidatus Woesearchaeota archaeon]|nr:RDD family protein [Candidatus Woesearchaeota archaeon]